MSFISSRDSWRDHHRAYGKALWIFAHLFADGYLYVGVTRSSRHESRAAI
jgi:hypothetical protein